MPVPFLYQKGKLQPIASQVLQVHGLNRIDELAIVGIGGPGIWRRGKTHLLDGKTRDGFPLANGGLPIGIDDMGNVLLVSHGVEGAFSAWTWPQKSDSKQWPMPTAIAGDGAIVGIKSRGRTPPPSTGPIAFLVKGAFRTPIGGPDELAIPSCVSRSHYVGGTFTTPPENFRRPFRWFGGKFEALPVPPECKMTVLEAINDRGDAVGLATWVGRPHEGAVVGHRGACLWSGAVWQELQHLLPDGAEYELLEAKAINSSGQILVIAAPKAKPFPRTLLLLTPG